MICVLRQIFCQLKIEIGENTRKMVLTKVFTFVFIFITEVNIVCKIREPFKFFMLNFKSHFLIVVIVARLYFTCVPELTHGRRCLFLNVVSEAVRLMKGINGKKVLKMHFHSVLLHISGSPFI